MSDEKQTTSGNSSYTPSANENRLTGIQGDIAEAGKAGQIQVNNSGLSAVNKLLNGQELPGYLNSLTQGISPDVTNSMVNLSLRDMNSQLAQSGAGTFMESGAAQQAGVRSAADIRNQSAQYNLNNLMQLLNIGVGGQASVQQPINSNNASLAGLIKGTGTTNTTSTVTSMNPFLKSFEQSTGNGSFFSNMGYAKSYGFGGNS